MPTFKTGDAAADEVHKYYRAWTRMLTTRSIELSFGVVAAHWAIHGSADTDLRP
ncbi:MAG: hypothetical protein ACYS0H_15115 [Planctomycetota bacterium]|jgi:hypothetical protein